MIKFNSVTKIYYPKSPNSSPIVALDDVSLGVGKNEFVSIVGRSGSGKTTLLKLLLGEEKPTKGQVFFEGEEVHAMKRSHLPEHRRKIGAVFQDYKLLPSKTTYENIAYIMEVMGYSDEEVNQNVSQVLEIVGLTSHANNFPHELSGGEKQRAAIARALIHRPDVILADEPTGNLDPYNTSDIIKLLIKINELGTTIMLASHNKEVVNSLGKRVITLEDGKIVRDQEKGKFFM